MYLGKAESIVVNSYHKPTEIDTFNCVNPLTRRSHKSEYERYMDMKGLEYVNV